MKQNVVKFLNMKPAPDKEELKATPEVNIQKSLYLSQCC